MQQHPAAAAADSPAKKHRTQHTQHAGSGSADHTVEEAAHTQQPDHAAASARALGPAPAPASPLHPVSGALSSRKRRASILDDGATAASVSTRAEQNTADDEGEHDDADADADAEPEEPEEADGDDTLQSHAAGLAATAARVESLNPAAVACVSLPPGVRRCHLITPLDHDWFFERDAVTAAPASHDERGAAAAPPLSTFLTAAQAALGLSSPAEVPQSMTRAQWNALRRAIGRTRRLSAACLREEALDLENQRAEWRQLQATHTHALPAAAVDRQAAVAPASHTPIYPSASWLSMENAQRSVSTVVASAAAVVAGPPSFASEEPAAFSPMILVEGSPVLVCHPSVPGSFAYATILSHAFHRVPLGSGYRHFLSVIYRVGFDGQAAAAPLAIEDSEVFCVPPQLKAEAEHASMRFMEERAKLFPLGLPQPAASAASSAAPAPFLSPAAASSDDVTLVCHLLQLVDRKRILLDQLHDMNDTMQILRQTSTEDVTNGQAATSTAQQQQRTVESVSVPAPAPPPAPADAASSFSQQLTQPSSMDIDSDMPSLESSTAAAAAAAHSTLLPALVSALVPPPPPLHVSAAEFRLSFDLFRRQYAWLVLQLESTSSSLDATHMQLRVRRATRRRSSTHEAAPYSSYAYPAPSPTPASFLLHSRDYGNSSVASSLSDDGSVASLVAEASDDFITPMLVELRPPLPLRGRGALLSHAGSAVHTLVSRAVALVLLIERGFAGADLQWLEINGERLLHALAPKHHEHRAMHNSIADAMHQLQDSMRASKAATARARDSI